MLNCNPQSKSNFCLKKISKIWYYISLIHQNLFSPVALKEICNILIDMHILVYKSFWIFYACLLLQGWSTIHSRYWSPWEAMWGHSFAVLSCRVRTGQFLFLWWSGASYPTLTLWSGNGSILHVQMLLCKDMKSFMYILGVTNIISKMPTSTFVL